jgi:hypothetical protein
VEPATTDRIQRVIDAEATERFPPDAVPRLVLLHHGDHPVIEPGELYLLVIVGQHLEKGLYAGKIVVTI